MSKPISTELLLQEYQKLGNVYQSLCQELSHQLDHLFQRENIKMAVPIQFRAKTWDSISNKISEGRFNVKRSITEIQDLAGLRIILLFKRDVEKVIILLKTNLETVREYNTELRLSETEFGYSSIHLVMRLRKEWLSVPTLSRFDGYLFEVQVRTLSQHNWAEASNVFQYKLEKSVPPPLKRAISRISALLEIVDFEFERLIVEREHYIQDIDVSGTNVSEKGLDVDVLVKLLNERLPAENKKDVEPYEELLEDLEILDFKTLKDVDDLIIQHLDTVLDEDRQRVIDEIDEPTNDETAIRAQKGVFYSHAGLIRIMMNKHFGRPWYKVRRERRPERDSEEL